ncbi:MAG: hypothetical protein V2I38_00815 [Alcanivoracaceae bacterium]|jgi:hypothetical protein|nr:hypothetical protein [Alcanivoracaceae bacterium]
MKLPEISYGRATPMQGRGPGEAVVKARGINEISSALTDSVNAIHEINNNYKISQATLRADNDLSALEQEYGSREFFTADEVKRFNLEGQVPLTEGEGLEREVIPAHEVYPLLVDRQYEDSIKTHAQNIRRPQDREKWNMEMTMRRNDRVTQEVQRAEQNAIQFTLKERMMDVTEAQASGNFDGAAMLINEVWAHDPGERREMLLENGVLQEQHTARKLAQNGSPEELREQAAYMRTDEYLKKSSSDSKAVADQASYLDRVAEIKEKAAADAADKAYDSQLDAHWQRYHDDPVGLVTNMPRGLKGADIRTLQNYAKARVGDTKIETNPDVYLSMQDALNDPNVSAADYRRKLLDSKTSLDAADWEYYAKQGEKKAAPPSYGQGVATDAQIISNAYGSLKLDTTAKSETKDQDATTKAAFLRLFNGEVQRQERNQGRELNADEKIQISDSITRELITKPEGSWWWQDQETGDVFDFIYQDLGEDQYQYDETLRMIEEALRVNGVPATQQEILRMYRAGKPKQ